MNRIAFTTRDPYCTVPYCAILAHPRSPAGAARGRRPRAKAARAEDSRSRARELACVYADARTIPRYIQSLLQANLLEAPVEMGAAREQLHRLHSGGGVTARA